MLKCPACASTQNKVADSRQTDSSIRRRRECLPCGERWTTYEITDTAFLAISDLDNVLADAGGAIAAAAKAIAILRDEGRLIEGDYGLRAYKPRRIGKAGFAPGVTARQNFASALPRSEERSR